MLKNRSAPIMLGRYSMPRVTDLEGYPFPEGDGREAGARLSGKNIYMPVWDRATHWSACGGDSKFSIAELGSEHRGGSRRV